MDHKKRNLQHDFINASKETQATTQLELVLEDSMDNFSNRSFLFNYQVDTTLLSSLGNYNPWSDKWVIEMIADAIQSEVAEEHSLISYEELIEQFHAEDKDNILRYFEEEFACTEVSEARLYVKQDEDDQSLIEISSIIKPNTSVSKDEMHYTEPNNPYPFDTHYYINDTLDVKETLWYTDF
ncbi:hypothetical protein AAG747_12265 [Rapidithrix thailandica]|uniref:Uncharacterized protein n=1 Tax=Rapidithrix thailandica TaxID=413964 RepID=A0AAW9SAA9_9BACT